jgi:tRNA(fMet)-specific endonuclease VapC
MGTVLDTTVFIQMERRLSALPQAVAMGDVIDRLGRSVEQDEPLGMASITASELLHGVHRATVAHRVRREAFVEALLSSFPPLPFDLPCARAHARLWAHLAAAGNDVGAHDRIVAATAMAVGWRVATANVRHFDLIPGLTVLPLDLTAEPTQQ